VKPNELIGSNITGVNQIIPQYNIWAWDLYISAIKNNWMPTEIGMQKDIEHWRSNTISNDEKIVIKRCLGFFAGSESLVGNNLLLSIFKYITDPECRSYISRQTYEETLHNLTIVYICQSLNLDMKEVYEAYQSIPSIKAKDDFLMEITSDVSRNNFSTQNVEGKRELLRNIITYYIVCEGIFFYSGFAMLLSFKRQNKFPGISEQIQYTLRDESLHIKFGTELINRIRSMYPKVWDEKFEQDTLNHIDKAVELEVQYAHDVLPRGILGLSASMFIDYMGYIAKRRLDSLNLPSSKYAKHRNPFPWMSEIIDLPKNKNFFESRVTEYQVGGLKDDME
jgi:ribonucleoside-diphosphate reductase beta chain